MRNNSKITGYAIKLTFMNVDEKGAVKESTPFRLKSPFGLQRHAFGSLPCHEQCFKKFGKMYVFVVVLFLNSGPILKKVCKIFI